MFISPYAVEVASASGLLATVLPFIRDWPNKRAQGRIENERRQISNDQARAEVEVFRMKHGVDQPTQGNRPPLQLAADDVTDPDEIAS